MDNKDFSQMISVAISWNRSKLSHIIKYITKVDILMTIMNSYACIFALESCLYRWYKHARYDRVPVQVLLIFFINQKPQSYFSFNDSEWLLKQCSSFVWDYSLC